ncbi:MAG: radical SAM protein [Thermoclostridium sp.]|nr:radical SAM protein [Thermoclostridium sp.]
MPSKKPYGSIIVTYRCNARCNMCDCWKHPTKLSEEITPDLIQKLPKMEFTNITGGEPFIRQDLSEIVREVYKKTNRIVISTNGYFQERILALCDQFPNIGIRISIEGLQQANDAIRGIPDGFDRGFGTLKKLVAKKHPDVGFGMTVQEQNAGDLLKLYQIADEYGMEFATATLHNSFYFRKTDNAILDKMKVAKAFEGLINALLKSGSPKKWFRAYFNHGLVNYLYDNKRLLPCEMGTNGFFMDPFGHIMPCNGSLERISMGDLHEKSWDEIWNSEQAQKVREEVSSCSKNCWMIGSAAPAMKQRLFIPAWWVMTHKLKGKYLLDENKFYNKNIS